MELPFLSYFRLAENTRFITCKRLEARERQAVKKPHFLIISQRIHTHKRHYSPPTVSYFLGRKLSLLFNKVFKKTKIVRYTD